VGSSGRQSIDRSFDRSIDQSDQRAHSDGYAGRVSEKTPPSIQPHAAEALLKSPAWQSEEQGRSAQQAQLNVSALDSAISAARQVSQQAWQNASLTSVRHAAEYATSDLKASGRAASPHFFVLFLFLVFKRLSVFFLVRFCFPLLFGFSLCRVFSKSANRMRQGVFGVFFLE
jgi:hypothetical protein